MVCVVSRTMQTFELKACHMNSLKVVAVCLEKHFRSRITPCGASEGDRASGKTAWDKHWQFRYYIPVKVQKEYVFDQRTWVMDHWEAITGNHTVQHPKTGRQIIPYTSSKASYSYDTYCTNDLFINCHICGAYRNTSRHIMMPWARSYNSCCKPNKSMLHFIVCTYNLYLMIRYITEKIHIIDLMKIK